MVKKSTAVSPAPESGDKELFFRIKEMPLKPGETYRGYQCEKITICNGTEVHREMVDKPNLFEYAQSKMLDLMDPRNHVKPAPASDFV